MGGSQYVRLENMISNWILWVSCEFAKSISIHLVRLVCIQSLKAILKRAVGHITTTKSYKAYDLSENPQNKRQTGFSTLIPIKSYTIIVIMCSFPYVCVCVYVYVPFNITIEI